FGSLQRHLSMPLPSITPCLANPARGRSSKLIRMLSSSHEKRPFIRASAVTEVFLDLVERAATGQRPVRHGAHHAEEVAGAELELGEHLEPLLALAQRSPGLLVASNATRPLEIGVRVSSPLGARPFRDIASALAFP